MRCPQTDRIDWAAYHADPTSDAWAEVRAHYPLCPDCSREVLRYGEMRRQLASTQPPLHPSEEELLAFDRRPADLTAGRQAEIELHIEGCRPCQNELAVLEAMMPVTLIDTARAPVERAGPLERIWSFLTSGPALAAAGMAVVVVIGWLVARNAPDPTRGPEPAPRLAEDAPSPGPTRTPGDVDPNRSEPSEQLAERTPETNTRPIPAPPEPHAPTPPALAPEPTEQLAERPSPPTESQIPAPEPPLPDRRAPEARQPPEELMLAALELPMSAPVYDPTAIFGFGDLGASRVDVVIRANSADSLPRVLGPVHTAITFEASPRLYWHLSTDSEAPVELLIVDPETDEVAFERTIEPPVQRGLHVVDLAAAGVGLEPDRTYRFFVSVVSDPERRDLDRTSGLTLLARPEATPTFSGPEGDRAHELAKAGSWVDAFATIQAWIDTKRAPEHALDHRRALLEQVQRSDVAQALDPRTGR